MTCSSRKAWQSSGLDIRIADIVIVIAKIIVIVIAIVIVMIIVRVTVVVLVISLTPAASRWQRSRG